MVRKRKAEEDLDVTSARDALIYWTNLYTNKDFGIGVQCDICDKWRLTFQYDEKKDVPEIWTCRMWQISEKKRGNCGIPSNLTEKDFAEEEYPPGSLVWAKVAGYPWWPAMVEDCPDKQLFYERDGNGDQVDPKKAHKYKQKLKKCIEEAQEAAQLRLKARLKKYSFAVKYKGKWAKVIQVHEELPLPPKCPVQKRLAESTDEIYTHQPERHTPSKRSERKRLGESTDEIYTHQPERHTPSKRSERKRLGESTDEVYTHQPERHTPSKRSERKRLGESTDEIYTHQPERHTPSKRSERKRLGESTDVKSPATKDENEHPAFLQNRHANGNHTKSMPLVNEKYCRLEKKITPVDKYERMQDDGIYAEKEDDEDDGIIEEDDYEDSEEDDIMSFDPDSERYQ